MKNNHCIHKFFFLPKWAVPILLHSHVLRKLCSSFIILHLPTCCPWRKKCLAEIENLSDNYYSIFCSFFSSFKKYFIKENDKEVSRWQLRSHLILKSRGPVPTDLLGTSDVVKGKKTNIGRSNGRAGWKWKVRYTSHQGVHETLSCPLYGKLPPIDNSGEERPMETAEKKNWAWVQRRISRKMLWVNVLRVKRKSINSHFSALCSDWSPGLSLGKFYLSTEDL